MITIKNWAADDRPREKLIAQGAKSLSDAELLAIVLGSGTNKLSALDLAKTIMSDVSNNFKSLSDRSFTQLLTYNGVGPAKAVGIMATLEIARRRLLERNEENNQIRSSKDAFEMLRNNFYDLKHEEFHVLYMNRANKIVGKDQVSKGGIAGTIADGKVIFRNAISHSASAMILAHNHPSGQLKPSEADRKLTKSLVDFGKMIDLQILDHLIVTNDKYFSFADEGLM